MSTRSTRGPASPHHRSAVLCGGMLGVLLFTFSWTASAGQQEAEEREPIPASECSACHDEADEFSAGHHGQLMARSAPELLEASCEICHGPGNDHYEDPLPENIRRNPPKEACIECHQASDSHLWLAARSHRRNQIECLDCHVSGHQPIEVAPMLQDEPFTLCGSCHAVQAAAFRQPFSHRKGSEPFACTDCHSAHGLERVGRLTMASANGNCTECHIGLTEPFVFPHPPRATHGCVTCHEPHGSNNPRQLNRHMVLNTCLECHTNVPSFHDVTSARFRQCTNCHTAVHGSNRDPKLFEQ